MAKPIINSIDPNGALEGGTVTITGSNFEASQGAGKTTWDTDGTPVDQLATAAVWNNTTIQTTVPTGIGPDGQGIFFTITNDSGETSDPFYFWIKSDNPLSEDPDYQIPDPVDSVEDVLVDNPSLAEAKDINIRTDIQKAIQNIINGQDPFPGRIVGNAEITIPDGDTDPDVSSGNDFVTSNTISVSIVEFINSLDGQLIRLRINDSNTTLKHNSGLATIPLNLINEQDIVTKPGEIYEFIRHGNQFDHVVDNRNSDFAGFFEQGSTPTTSQIKEKKYGIWFDTSNSILYYVINRSNVIFGVELNQF